MLNLDSWKNFKLTDLFEISGSRTTSLDELKEKYSSGKYPYVTTQSINNGVSGYFDYYTEQGNCLVVDSAVLGYCTYQKKNFSASDHVEILRPKFFMDDYLAYFLVTIINQENYKYSYGRKRSQVKLRQEIIKLPVNKQGEPDYIFMRQYIKKLEENIRVNSSTINQCLSTNNDGCNDLFNKKEWNNFKLRDLFLDGNIYKAKPYIKGNLNTYNVLNPKRIPFVTRTEINNGVDCYVDKDDINVYEKGNAISIGDTTATFFYQKNDFATGDHIVICRAPWLNKYTGLFLQSVVQKNKYRYSYGRAFKMKYIINTEVYLPSIDNRPDWKYIEEYIMSLPYGDKI